VDAPSSPTIFYGLSASLAHQEQPAAVVRQPNRFVNGDNGRFGYSRELKRQFCLFRRNWMSARTDGVRFESWQSALGAFFRSHFQFFDVSTPTERATRNWWSQRHKYLTEEELSTCVDPGRSGDGGFRAAASNVGIGSECNDSASGGWDDCMGDAAPRHEAQAQGQAQSQSGESPSSRVADTASAEAAAVDAASDHASPAAAATAEGTLAFSA
jgi:hypothetical protein